MQSLRADTQVKVVIGPVVAVGDGFTPVTNLDLTTADEAELMKHDAAAVTDISGNTFAAIANMDGYYNLTLSSGNLDTEGMLTVGINDDSLCLPVAAKFMVENAVAYDAKYAAAGTDYLQVDVVQVGGATQSATDLKDFADAGYDPATHKVQGVVLTDTTTTNTDMVSQANITAILADTNELQTDWVNGGRLDLLIDGIKAITDTLTLAAIADAVHDEVVDSNAPANCNSLRETINVIASAVAGKCSGVDTDTPTFRDLGDTKNRLVTAIDANDNRTASTPDGT